MRFNHSSLLRKIFTGFSTFHIIGVPKHFVELHRKLYIKTNMVFSWLFLPVECGTLAVRDIRKHLMSSCDWIFRHCPITPVSFRYAHLKKFQPVFFLPLFGPFDLVLDPKTLEYRILGSEKGQTERMIPLFWGPKKGQKLQISRHLGPERHGSTCGTFRLGPLH